MNAVRLTQAQVDAVVASAYNACQADHAAFPNGMRPADAAKLPLSQRRELVGLYRAYAKVPANRALYTMEQADQAFRLVLIDTVASAMYVSPDSAALLLKDACTLLEEGAASGQQMGDALHISAKEMVAYFLTNRAAHTVAF